MKLLTLTFLALLALAAPAAAQTHNCSVAQPTSGTATAGDPLTLHACHPGVDTNGNPITGWKLYVDSAAGVPVTMTKSPTAGTDGFDYTVAVTAPATAGPHSYQVTTLSGTAESQKSNPFVLTVSLPRVAPAAPTKVNLQ